MEFDEVLKRKSVSKMYKPRYATKRSKKLLDDYYDMGKGCAKDNKTNAQATGYLRGKLRNHLHIVTPDAIITIVSQFWVGFYRHSLEYNCLKDKNEKENQDRFDQG